MYQYIYIYYSLSKSISKEICTTANNKISQGWKIKIKSCSKYNKNKRSL